MKREIKNILVVDDEQGICAMLTKFLRSAGYFCNSRTEPVEALEILKEGAFDLVISDIQMAGMDGIELLSRIRELSYPIDTIMMTGLTRKYTYSDIIDAGAADFIAKPFQL
ncbi:MAG: response regulator, partial [Syntrophobacteraceae bacterium]